MNKEQPTIGNMKISIGSLQAKWKSGANVLNKLCTIVGNGSMQKH